jgi:hypothetical protein
MFNFLPKDDKFFDQLDNLARMLVSAAQQLSAILQTFPRFDPQRQEIEGLREKAGILAQDSFAILDKARLLVHGGSELAESCERKA